MEPQSSYFNFGLPRKTDYQEWNISRTKSKALLIKLKINDCIVAELQGGKLLFTTESVDLDLKRTIMPTTVQFNLYSPLLQYVNNQFLTVQGYRVNAEVMSFMLINDRCYEARICVAPVTYTYASASDLILMVPNLNC